MNRKLLVTNLSEDIDQQELRAPFARAGVPAGPSSSQAPAPPTASGAQAPDDTDLIDGAMDMLDEGAPARVGD